jgi:hypothetical protein
MTAYPGQTRTTLGQLCAALWDSQSRPDVIQLGFEPVTLVTPLALRCSDLDCCATQETIWLLCLALLPKTLTILSALPHMPLFLDVA